MWFIPTYENGGFYTWFWNSTGDWADLTVTTLRRTGALQSALAVEKAIGVFPSTLTLQDRHARINFLESCSEAIVDQLERLDDEVNYNDEDVYQLLLNYWLQST